MIALGNETIELLTFPMVNDHGRLVPDTSAEPQAEPHTECLVLPGVSTELVGHRDLTAIRWTVYVFNPADLSVFTDDSLVRVRDAVYQVDGQPQTWELPGGADCYVLLYLIEWED